MKRCKVLVFAIYADGERTGRTVHIDNISSGYIDRCKSYAAEQVMKDCNASEVSFRFLYCHS